MKIEIKIDLTKIRKRVPKSGGAMTPKKGKGAYSRKEKHKQLGE